MNRMKVVVWIVIIALALAACGAGNTLGNSTGSSSTVQDSAPPINSQGNMPGQGQPSGSGGGQGGQAPAGGQTNQAPAPAAGPDSGQSKGAGLTYVIVDTGQQRCYDNGREANCPAEGSAFYGQDAQYAGVQPSYVDNGDGTISDLNTGLMWQQDPGEKMTYPQAAANLSAFSLAGYTDWRLPTIKELYSLIAFNGTDASACMEQGACTATPFLDTSYFHFEYGDTAAGERTIDSQWATSTLYVSQVMNGQQAMFGVNFADGRIKGYGIHDPRGGQDKTFFVIYVRGNPSYGINHFVDNGNGTVSDQASGLTWMQTDSGSGLNWEGALAYCSSLDAAGFNDWRLPNAKELHSIVDYSRSPDTSNSAAIDPIFGVSSITNEAGQPDYPGFWSSTTHVTSDGRVDSGVYIAFGEALGYMNNQWMDVHGAGAQRADIKSGDPAQLPIGRGPQGDAMRIYNYARCVRGGSQAAQPVTTDPAALQAPGAQPTPGAQSPAGGQTGANQGSGGGAGPAGGGQMPGGATPPLEAIQACSGLTEAMACTINPPQGGALAGVCTTIQTVLACVPQGGSQGGPPAGP